MSNLAYFAYENPLTVREIDILRLIGQGLQNKEIADQLALSPLTIKDYNKRIFSKLYVDNRVEAVLAGMALGIIPIPQVNPQHSKMNIPAQRTPFFGRKSELSDLVQLVRNEAHRLITITGPGGIGKTRLALQVAKTFEQDEHFTDGIGYLSFLTIESELEFITKLLEILGLPYLPQNKNDAIRQILTFLTKKSTLLIFDNFENFLSGKTLLSEILSNTETCNILVTSREALRLYGEYIYPIYGLQTPDSGASTRSYSSVELFVDSAKRTTQTFALDDNQQVAEICQLVEGFPLAIELAASWCAVLSPAQIMQEIQQGLAILSTDLVDIPERHRSIQVVFEQSYQMLPHNLQQWLLALSIFRGGFSFDAASNITGIQLEHLHQLIHKSLLYYTEDGRYQFHELIRQFAFEKLQQQPFYLAEIQTAYMIYFAEWISVQTDRFSTTQQTETVYRFNQEFANIRHTWELATNMQDEATIRKSTWGLTTYLLTTNRLQEGKLLFQDTLQQLPKNIDIVVKARLEASLGSFCVHLDNLSDAEKYLRKSIEVFDPSHPFELAFCYRHLADIAGYRGQYPQAQITYEKASQIYEELNRPELVANIQNRLGWSKFQQGQYHEAQIDHQSALDLFQRFDIPSGLARSYQYLGSVARELGQIESSIEYYEKALEISNHLDNSHSAMDIYHGLGDSYVIQGNLDQAEFYFYKAYKMAYDVGFRIRWMTYANNLGVVEFRRGNYKKAENWYQVCLDAALEIEDRVNISLAWSNLGKLSHTQGRFQEALQNYEKSLAIRRDMNYKRGLIYTLNYLGDTHVALNNTEQAWASFLEALSLAIEIDSPVVGLDALYRIGRLQFNEGNDKAIEILHLVVHHPSTDHVTRKDALNLLSSEFNPHTSNDLDWKNLAASILQQNRDII